MLTVTFKTNRITMDIMVKYDQRISDVVRILAENGRIKVSEEYLIFSGRKKEYINSLLTFRQAEVYNGDILELIERS